MKRIFVILAVVLVATMVLSTSAGRTFAQATPPATTKPLVMYMQEGGDPGIASVLARTNGSEAAAKALGIELHEQYASWKPQNMIDQFKQAIAAAPDCIEVMDHPGEAAMDPLVDQAEAAGIVVTSGNNPLPMAQAKYQSKGFGYAGVDLHAGGFLVGQAMLAAGLKKGDHALVWDIWHQEGRSQSPQGIYDALTAAGVIVDKLDVTDAIDADATQGIPVLTAYLAAHPDLKAIGTQHGQITAIIPKVLQQAGKKPGDIIVGGIDLGPDTLAGIQQGYIAASLDQLLYLQGYYPVQQCWLTKMFKMPGLVINTGAGVFTKDNLETIAPLIQAGFR